MNRRGHKGRTDANHGDVVKALRQMRWFVLSLAAVGDGCPDLLAAKQGRLLLLEVKDGTKPASQRKLTAREQQVHAELAAHGVPVHLLERVEDLAQLDREARQVYEGVPPREFYSE